MGHEHIRVEIDGNVATVTLDRPDQRNALSLEIMEEVTSALADLGGRRQVAAIVMAGNGPAFSAGHDMGEMIGRPQEFFDLLFAQCTRMMQTIHDVPQPVIAKVHGIATAAGCQLVASCDLVVAAADATFATPGVKIGLFCTTPMVPVSRAVGPKRAMEMLLTGEPISAQTAQEWGLVNRVVPRQELDQEVRSLITSITRYSPTVIGLGKNAFYRQAGVHEDQAYAITEPIMARSATADDAQEGFKAFKDKREPNWSHQEATP